MPQHQVLRTLSRSTKIKVTVMQIKVSDFCEQLTAQVDQLLVNFFTMLLQKANNVATD